jgi:hypothetical protein
MRVIGTLTIENDCFMGPRLRVVSNLINYLYIINCNSIPSSALTQITNLKQYENYRNKSFAGTKLLECT